MPQSSVDYMGRKGEVGGGKGKRREAGGKGGRPEGRERGGKGGWTSSEDFEHCTIMRNIKMLDT